MNNEKVCTLCNEKGDQFEITGMKALKGQLISYQLCPLCCRGVQPLSIHSPADLKKRRDFWDNIWGRLVETCLVEA